MFENKCMIVMMMACVVVIVVQKRFEFEFSKTLGPAFFWKVQKEFRCGRCDRGLWGLESMKSMKIMVEINMILISTLSSIWYWSQLWVQCWENNGKTMGDEYYFSGWRAVNVSWSCVDFLLPKLFPRTKFVMFVLICYD